jgi:hypothetical protein
MMLLISLVYSVVVLQVRGKGGGNVTPHNTEGCPLGTADGGTRGCKCFQLLHHRLHELQKTVVTGANIQDGLQKWDISAKDMAHIQYFYYFLYSAVFHVTLVRHS